MAPRTSLLDEKDVTNRNGESPTNNVIDTQASVVADSTPSSKNPLGRRDRVASKASNLISGRAEGTILSQRAKAKTRKEVLATGAAEGVELKTPSITGKTPRQLPAGTGREQAQRVTKGLKFKQKDITTPFSALTTEGQTKLERARLGALGKVKPGEFIDSNFQIAAQPAGGTQRKGKQPGIFTQAGTEAFFQSAGDLAQKFLSPEFQKQLATQRTAASTRKGARADSKAKTDRIKALTGVLSSVQEGGGDPELEESLRTKLSQLSGTGIQDPRIRVANLLREIAPNASGDILERFFSELEQGK
jgi:hypothetical protein